MSYEPLPVTEESAGILAATLGITQPGQAMRLAKDVAQAANAAFGDPPAPRPSRRSEELHELLLAIKASPGAVPEVPRHLWPWLDIEEQHEADDLLASPERLAHAVERALKLSESDSARIQDRKGGRRRDPRIDGFAIALAQIYEGRTGNRPTYTADKDTGNIVSPFGLFAYEAFHQFYPGKPVPEGSIRSAIQQAVRFERESETIPDEELDEFFSDDA